MRAAFPIMAVLAATILAAPIAAQAQSAAPAPGVERIGNMGAISIDPAQGYLLIEGARPLVFNIFAEPSEADRAQWADERATALTAARTDYQQELERFERRARGARRRAPTEPTDANFAWPDLESRRIIAIGPQAPFASTAGGYLWLTSLPPGDYVYYGTGRQGSNICACMGSVRFSVAAGRITTMRLDTVVLDQFGNRVTGHPAGTSVTDREARTGLLVEAGAMADPRLPAELLEPAQFAPVSALPNWFGGSINRVLPIAGVLDYDRGRVVDLRPAAAEPAPVPMIEAAPQP